jgi:sugar O-acyltransferase (sialic acid O-acetyltransferase NeuD family)
MKESLVLLGGGGHCLSCIDVIEVEARYEIAGIVMAEGSTLQSVGGYPVIGTDNDIATLASAGHQFLVTVGQIRSASARVRLYKLLVSLRAQLATVFSPYSIVSQNARIGQGSIVMHQAIINSGAQIGVNCILNTQALVEHEAIIGDHCHISTGAKVNGSARISDRTFLGSGSIILNQVLVASDCLIGAGSVVLGDIEKSGSYVGVPAKRIQDSSVEGGNR